MNKPITVVIRNMRGLHARASARVVKCVEGFDAEITLTCEDRSADALSMMDLLMLGAYKNCQVSIDGRGPEAEKAIEAIVTLIQDKFGEER